MHSNFEQLFLLEIVVDQIVLDQFEDCDSQLLHTEFKFNGLPCFEIARGSGVGKSCLFCIEPLALVHAMENEPIVLSVWWKPEPYITPTIIARSKVYFAESIIDLVRSVGRQAPRHPVEGKFHEFFRLESNDNGGEHMGEVYLIIRLTCYGRTILTSLTLIPGSRFHFDSGVRENLCEACVEMPESVEPEKRAEKSDKICDTEDLAIEQTIPQEEVPKEEKKPSVDAVPVEPKKRKLTGKGPVIRYPGVTIGHRFCQGQRNAISSNHGWDWMCTTPLGVPPTLSKAWKEWRPGCYLRAYKKSLINPPYVLPKPSGKFLKIPERIQKKITPYVNIIRKNGEYKIKVHPPDTKDPLEYTHPADPEDSDMEVEFELPEPYPERKTYCHQAQQFCEEDLPLPKPVRKKGSKKKIDKPKDGGKGDKVKKGKGKKPKVEELKVKPAPWDDWIMKLRCDGDLSKLVWRPKKKREPKREEIVVVEKERRDEKTATKQKLVVNKKKVKKEEEKAKTKKKTLDKKNSEKAKGKKKNLDKSKGKKEQPKKFKKKSEVKKVVIEEEVTTDVKGRKVLRKPNPNARLPFCTLKKIYPRPCLLEAKRLRLVEVGECASSSCEIVAECHDMTNKCHFD